MEEKKGRKEKELGLVVIGVGRVILDDIAACDLQLGFAYCQPPIGLEPTGKNLTVPCNPTLRNKLVLLTVLFLTNKQKKKEKRSSCNLWMQEDFFFFRKLGTQCFLKVSLILKTGRPLMCCPSHLIILCSRGEHCTKRLNPPAPLILYVANDQ